MTRPKEKCDKPKDKKSADKKTKKANQEKPKDTESEKPRKKTKIVKTQMKMMKMLGKRKARRPRSET